MLNRITVKGHRGALLWGAGDAARLGAWSATRPERGRAWTLRASLTWHDSYRVQQLPLYFTAPQTAKPGGQWCFPVIPHSLRITERGLTAQLGQPEG